MSSRCRICNNKMPETRKGFEQVCPDCKEKGYKELWEKEDDFLKTFIQGYANQKDFSVYLESEHYAIIKIKGGSFWSGMGGNSYCPVQYTIICKGTTTWSGFKKDIHTGRLRKEDKRKLQFILNYYEVNYE